MEKEMKVKFFIRNTSFTDIGDMNVQVECRGKSIIGNFNLEVPIEEYTEALSTNTLMELVTKYFAAINEEALKVQENQIEALKKENEELRQQMNMSNISMTLMMKDMEKNILEKINKEENIEDENNNNTDN